jgi:periplasmic divalent cation tolerance protein
MAELAHHLQVLTTLDDRGAAEALARAVVEARLAACAQVVGPVTSVYRWGGDIEQAAEWYCVMKTTGERYPALAAWIGQHHPYDTPELVATAIVAGAPGYLDWIAAETSDEARD